MAFGLCVCVAPDLCAFAWWDGGLRAVFVERVVAFPLIIGAVGADLFDLYGHILKQIWQRFGVADIVGAGHDADYFERRFVHAKVEFAPSATFPDAVLADFPLTFAVNFDSGRIYNQMESITRWMELDKFLTGKVISSCRRRRESVE